MHLIIGLGNPGKKYEKTRHNAGFMVLDVLEKKELGVRLLKPDTFMNNSGSAVKKEMQKLKIKSQNLLVIHDDIDIPLGKTKVSKGSGSAGHKGVESIIQALGTKDFTRIRIGILPPEGKPEDVETFVLKNFKKEELPLLKAAIASALSTLTSKLNEI
ncbi:MAG: peptidyl-tRNA hydrolase [Candidatus Wildermuthbacteria bacterium]|nr:peptidyl-tRNA hydrolase [Candidatus Wildermuthbacteria bacterium]